VDCVCIQTGTSMQKLVLSRGKARTRHIWRKSVRVYDVICVCNDKARARDAWIVFAFKRWI